MYFSLAPFIYAARYERSIIILNVLTNKYLSLIGNAAFYFEKICDSKFSLEKNLYHHETNSLDLVQLNQWISHFLGKGFIISTTKLERNLIAPLPLIPGGLNCYKWDSKPSWKPFTETSIKNIAEAFLQLAKVHRSLKAHGMQQVVESVKRSEKKFSQTSELFIPQEEEIRTLACAIDAASILYPKKTLCLAWATTYTLLALKKRWKCNLMIGVQTTPFYAHAWADLDGKVVHDHPVVAQSLSIILKEPRWKD